MRRYLPAFALISLCGCASLKDLGEKALSRPTLEFKGASLDQVSLSSATVDLLYSIGNSNPVGLSLANVNYALLIEGKEILGGSRPQGLRIPANGSAEIHLPVSVHFAELASTLEAFLRKDTAAYEAKGELGIATPVGTVQLPLAAKGQMEVPKIPKLDFGSPHLERLSAQGATVSIPVTVTNRNSYALPIDNLSGALRLGGAPVANVSTGSVGDLAAKSSHQLTVPLSLNFRGASEALTSQAATEIDFTGALSSGGASVPVHLTQLVKLQR